MKRYYLSKIKAVQIPGMGTVYRHRFQELAEKLGLNITYVGGEIDVDPATGIPTQAALLILVDTVDHTPFAGDNEMADFPDGGLDVKVASIGAVAKNLSKGKMKKVGLTPTDVDSLWQQADGLRDIINALGKRNNPAFDSLNFDTTG